MEVATSFILIESFLQRFLIHNKKFYILTQNFKLQL